MTQFEKIEKEVDDFVWKWSDNPFFSSAFIKGGAKLSSSRGWDPLIVVIYDSNGIVGFTPLATRNRFGIRLAQFLYGPNFLMDIVVDDEHDEVCISQVLRILTKVLKCKFVDLTFSAESKTLKIIEKFSRAEHVYFATDAAAFGGHRVVPVTSKWEEFVKMRGKKFRAEAKRVERKVGELVDWAVTCIEQMEQDPEVCEKILRIDEHSWKKEWLSSKNFKYDPELAVTLDTLPETAKKRSIFRWQVYFLTLEGAPIAYVLVFRMKTTAFIKRTSYVAAYKHFSPGMFILNYSIRKLFDEGKVKAIDFCADHPYQETWATLCLSRTDTRIRNSLLLLMIERILVSTTMRKKARVLKSLLFLRQPKSN
jgi:CelD/BcsL family acetyltransferase involved in cellulose biosynthesis